MTITFSPSDIQSVEKLTTLIGELEGLAEFYRRRRRYIQPSQRQLHAQRLELWLQHTFKPHSGAYKAVPVIVDATLSGTPVRLRSRG